MTILPASNDNSKQLEEYRKFLALAEDKTVITLIERLLNVDLLEFITEYPSTTYTKEMTKLMTYAQTYMQTYNIRPDEDGNYDNDDITMIQTMCHQFMLKMTSHKRRRAHEVVNGASRQDTGQAVNETEHKGLRRFLGMK